MNRAVKILTAVITGYQKLISPVLGDHCRFYPSCSQYAKEALEEWGIFRGSFYAVRRLLKCHPLHPGGIDYAPVKRVRG